MKFLFDLFPVFLFFSVFKWSENHADVAQSWIENTLSRVISDGLVTQGQAPTLLATAVAIVATMAQIGYLLARRKKVDGMLWLSFVIILFFGGATIYFHDENFIKWKPTVLYWCFALTLWGSQLFLKKNLIRTMMEAQITLPQIVWQRLNLAWIAFFSGMGGLNLYVAFNFPIATWVNFKLFGAIGLMLVFVVAQSVLLSPYMKDSTR